MDQKLPHSPGLHPDLYLTSPLHFFTLFFYISCFISGSFACDSHIVAVYGENLYTVEPNRVQIRTPQVCSPTLEIVAHQSAVWY